MAMCKVSSSVHFVTRSVGTVREGSPKAQWVPNTDVYVTDNGLVIKVELSGMRSENLEITVEGNRLRISGTRPDGCRAAKCSFLVCGGCVVACVV
jgi:HSP20 family protein